MLRSEMGYAASAARSPRAPLLSLLGCNIGPGVNGPRFGIVKCENQLEYPVFPACLAPHSIY
jgi:hypothetical protein